MSRKILPRFYRSSTSRPRRYGAYRVVKRHAQSYRHAVSIEKMTRFEWRGNRFEKSWIHDKYYIGHLEEGTRCCYRVELGLIILNEVKTKRETDTKTGLIDIVSADD